MSAPLTTVNHEARIAQLRNEIALQRMAVNYTYHQHIGCPESYTDEAAHLESLESELEALLFKMYRQAKLSMRLEMAKMNQAVKDEKTALAMMEIHKSSPVESRLAWLHKAIDAEKQFDAASQAHTAAIDQLSALLTHIPDEMRKGWEAGEEVEA